MLYDAVIIGAGIAGLSCARTLQRKNLSYIILEQDKRPGGRIKTDVVDGFKLDRGFQVLQTGYPEAQKTLDYSELQLKKFPAGVAVYHSGKFNIIADPRYHPRHIFSTIGSSVGTLMDRLHMLRLSRSVSKVPFERLFIEPEEKTIDYLQKWGFSKRFIQRFFVPFFAGACLDRNITASSRVLRYIFRVFANGDAALPAQGMEAIPQQLAKDLSPDRLFCNSTVVSVDNGNVILADGQTYTAKMVIPATSHPSLTHLISDIPDCRSVGESCLYFAADWQPPLSDPFLILNGEPEGPVNNIAFPSLVAPGYSTSGKTLIAIVVLGEEYQGKTELVDLVKDQCREMFGSAVNDWDHLHTYSITHALPDQQPPTANPYDLPPQPTDKLLVCGEHGSLPGTQWSLLSGRLTGEAAIRELVA